MDFPSGDHDGDMPHLAIRSSSPVSISSIQTSQFVSSRRDCFAVCARPKTIFLPSGEIRAKFSECGSLVRGRIRISGKLICQILCSPDRSELQTTKPLSGLSQSGTGLSAARFTWVAIASDSARLSGPAFSVTHVARMADSTMTMVRILLRFRIMYFQK